MEMQHFKHSIFDFLEFFKNISDKSKSLKFRLEGFFLVIFHIEEN